ncbi:hypothetical protein RMR10_004565 [Agrobacterium rosae]|uniref:hypothetical protein n=1 Tax=Agrobacterium rosae TaxID=1972867 RepID=UPI002A0E14AC|nr:hypothetical protein [Agrobacterium rosae]MDX8315605.1 hypothetical protein [Agrobacterium rosae]
MSERKVKSLLRRISGLLDDLSPDDDIGFSDGVKWVSVATVREIRSAAYPPPNCRDKESEVTKVEVGKTYIARNQGHSITPRTVEATVVWIDGDNVHYRLEGETAVKQTTVDRFMEIVGLSGDAA